MAFPPGTIASLRRLGRNSQSLFEYPNAAVSQTQNGPICFSFFRKRPLSFGDIRSTMQPGANAVAGTHNDHTSRTQNLGTFSQMRRDFLLSASAQRVIGSSEAALDRRLWLLAQKLDRRLFA